MIRPLSPIAIKDTITAICADPAHRKPLAEDPQIAAQMQDVLRRMVNAAAGNERMGEMTLVALLGHAPARDVEWQAIKRWINPSLGRDKQWHGDPALPVECQDILRSETGEEIDLVAWLMVKDTTPIQVSYHGKVIVDAIPDPLSNERGVFAFIASDGEPIHNLRADTKLRVTVHPARSGETITVGEWLAMDEACRPAVVYGALDERVMSIYPDTLSPDLFTIKFETYGAGSKSPDTLLYLAKTIIEGVEVQEGEAITFEMGAIEITRIARAIGGQPKVEFKLRQGFFPPSYEIANAIFGTRQSGCYKPVTLYQKGGFAVLYEAAELKRKQ
mgnify:CR=1 FL=1